MRESSPGQQVGVVMTRSSGRSCVIGAPSSPGCPEPRRVSERVRRRQGLRQREDKRKSKTTQRGDEEEEQGARTREQHAVRTRHACARSWGHAVVASVESCIGLK
jgi:hypothetical protein